VAHEFLRRDIADAATGQPVEMSPRKWESSWRKFPISIWMQEQEGRSWFAIHRDSLRVAFECDERLRGPLESMSGELVDFRLAAHPRPRASATGFVATSARRGQPGLFTAFEDGELLIDLCDHLAHARLGESLFADGMIALEVGDPLLEDAEVAVGLLVFSGVGDHR
jgi:hypothetical protein